MREWLHVVYPYSIASHRIASHRIAHPPLSSTADDLANGDELLCGRMLCCARSTRAQPSSTCGGAAAGSACRRRHTIVIAQHSIFSIRARVATPMLCYAMRAGGRRGVRRAEWSSARRAERGRGAGSRSHRGLTKRLTRARARSRSSASNHLTMRAARHVVTAIQARGRRHEH